MSVIHTYPCYTVGVDVAERHLTNIPTLVNILVSSTQAWASCSPLEIRLPAKDNDLLLFIIDWYYLLRGCISVA